MINIGTLFQEKIGNKPRWNMLIHNLNHIRNRLPHPLGDPYCHDFQISEYAGLHGFDILPVLQIDSIFLEDIKMEIIADFQYMIFLTN